MFTPLILCPFCLSSLYLTRVHVQVREKSSKSIPMGRTGVNRSAGTPDSLSDNESPSYRTPRKPSLSTGRTTRTSVASGKLNFLKFINSFNGDTFLFLVLAFIRSKFSNGYNYVTLLNLTYFRSSEAIRVVWDTLQNHLLHQISKL